jgi:hypothetical protein
VLIKEVTKPRVLTKFVIVEADLNYVSSKLGCVLYSTARQEATLSPQNTQQNRSRGLTSKREKCIKIN